MSFPFQSGLRASIFNRLVELFRSNVERFPDERTGIALAPKTLALPRLPKTEFSIRVREDAEEAARRLAAVLANGLRTSSDLTSHAINKNTALAVKNH